MTQELAILVITAASLGFFHTVLGPDHYLPFIVMSKARGWSRVKTVWVTAVCGIGHIASSVLLGVIGIALGITVTKLEAIESARGEIAAWLLIGFGLVYFVWGLRKALRNRPHEHIHPHEYGVDHIHRHQHVSEHVHLHGEKTRASLTPWILFTIFVFGPCEVLIPVLMYPAAKGSYMGLALVIGVFGLVTITTMLSIVLVSSFGLKLLPVGRLERYTHALAGATICVSGLGIRLLGL